MGFEWIDEAGDSEKEVFLLKGEGRSKIITAKEALKLTKGPSLDISDDEIRQAMYECERRIRDRAGVGATNAHFRCLDGELLAGADYDEKMRACAKARRWVEAMSRRNESDADREWNRLSEIIDRIPDVAAVRLAQDKNRLRDWAKPYDRELSRVLGQIMSDISVHGTLGEAFVVYRPGEDNGVYDAMDRMNLAAGCDIARLLTDKGYRFIQPAAGAQCDKCIIVSWRRGPYAPWEPLESGSADGQDAKE